MRITEKCQTLSRIRLLIVDNSLTWHLRPRNQPAWVIEEAEVFSWAPALIINSRGMSRSLRRTAQSSERWRWDASRGPNGLLCQIVGAISTSVGFMKGSIEGESAPLERNEAQVFGKRDESLINATVSGQRYLRKAGPKSSQMLLIGTTESSQQIGLWRLRSFGKTGKIALMHDDHCEAWRVPLHSYSSQRFN